MTIRRHEADDVVVARTDLAIGARLEPERIACRNQASAGFKVAIGCGHERARPAWRHGRSLRDPGDYGVGHTLRTGSGENSKSEELGLGDHEFVPWNIGGAG